MKRFGLPILLIAVAGGLIAIFVFGNKAKPATTTNNVKLDEQQFPNLGQKHINPGEGHDAYNSNPPSSGPHYPQPTAWGIKDSELPDETLIHNLEHGGIEIAYRPDLPADQIQKLKDLYSQLPLSQQFNETKAVLVPRSHNDHPISLVAWTYVLNLDSFDATKIQQFYSAHIDKGPELIP